MIEALVDEKAVKEEVIGLVSPHAGYVYSGPVAGATISRIVFKDTFIIIGPNHTGLGKPCSIMTEGTWTTPLGEVEIDSELGYLYPITYKKTMLPICRSTQLRFKYHSCNILKMMLR